MSPGQMDQKIFFRLGPQIRIQADYLYNHIKNNLVKIFLSKTIKFLVMSVISSQLY